MTRNTGFSQWAAFPRTRTWWASKFPDWKEVKGTMSLSHCSLALLLCVNSEGLGGLCLGSQCHFHIHFMGANAVITCVFWASIKVDLESDSCTLHRAEGFLWGSCSVPGGEAMSQERMVRTQGSGFTKRHSANFTLFFVHDEGEHTQACWWFSMFEAEKEMCLHESSWEKSSIF